MSMCVSTAQARTKRGPRDLGPALFLYISTQNGSCGLVVRHFSGKFPDKLALVTCPCAFGLRRLICVLSSVLSSVCSHMRAFICVLSYVCSPMCSHTGALIGVLSYVLSYVCSHRCAFFCVLSYVCSHLCAFICVLSYVCSHMCALICVL